MSILSAEGVAFDVKVPVVIIGSGAAGLVAALSVCEAREDVLVVERDAVPRGSTALSAGLIPAPGTRWQKAAGIVDSPELFGSDIAAKAKAEPEPMLVKAVTEAIGPAIEWLADKHGLPFSLIEDFRYPGHSVCRMHGLPSRSGGELIDRLRDAAAQAGVDLLCNAHVTSLFAELDGRIAGVEVKRPDGSKELIGCGALILACNGYGGNKDLVQRHISELGAALYFGHEGNQGDALLWGQALGAATRHLSGHQGHGSVAHPHGILITWATITEGGFQVNLRGERFSDESHGYSEQAAVVLRQPDGLAWTIFDARIAGIARQFEDFRQAEALGAILTATTIENLARQTSLPVETIKATFEEVDALKQGGGLDRFGRNLIGAPPLQSPYHAVRVTGALFHTQGGLVVDGNARVMRENGTALPNLLAVGGAACGVSGSKAEGYLSGNGLLSAVALGRLAGVGAVHVEAS
jgi:fumarate reductase flavoprotein subunit